MTLIYFLKITQLNLSFRTRALMIFQYLNEFDGRKNSYRFYLSRLFLPAVEQIQSDRNEMQRNYKLSPRGKLYLKTDAEGKR